MPRPERFLHNKFEDLQKTPEVESAVSRQSIRKREKLSNTPEDRLGAYLSRLEEIYETSGDEKLQGKNTKEFRLDYIKNQIIDSAVPLRHIKPENLPDNFFDLDKRIAREQGHGNVEITDDMKEQILESTIKDQEASLSSWFDYLASKDATYPMWLKYFAMRSITNMGDFDKTKHVFKKRSQFTRSIFPDLNREALAYVLDAMEKKYGLDSKEDDLNDPEFSKLLLGANFGKLYAFAVEKVTPASQEQKENIEGQWVKYDQGSDHTPLYRSLQGHGTGWCTAGESTAQAQLKQGDFYVYYSLDESSQPSIPRIAIRMQNNQIAEIRGINPDQNLEPALVDIAKEKAQTLNGHEAYEKKSSDMKELTAIEKKMEKGQNLIKDDLVFLYEINESIQGFGYEKDPRIKELRDQRNSDEDMLVIFECEESQIVHNQEELKEAIKQEKDIKAYVGELFPNIFKLLPANLEHIYTSFPEGKIRKMKAEIGGESKEDLIKEIKTKFKNSDFAISMMKNPDFIVQKEKEGITLIKLKVQDLGFTTGATIKKIFERADELGLELCPPETGPQLRKQYLNQPLDEWFRIGMKPIDVSDGILGVFYLGCDDGGLWLSHSWAASDHRWFSASELVFRLRQVFPET